MPDSSGITYGGGHGHTILAASLLPKLEQLLDKLLQQEQEKQDRALAIEAAERRQILMDQLLGGKA